MIAYIDIISGISGDMLLGALIDAGYSIDKLRKELDKLGIEYEIKAKKEKDGPISATSVYIHSEERKIRRLKDIIKIIDDSQLEEDIKEKSKEIFKKIAGAEAKIHGIDIEKVIFHEIGAVDTIIDVVGSLISLKELGIKKVYSSPVLLGRGKIKSEHGILPVPATATIELLKNKPVIFTTTPTEITTPTGAALLSLAEFSYPEMEIKKVGYGKGKKKLDFPNILRVVIGKEMNEGELYIIETNIDDMNPEFYPYIIDKLLKSGAMDVFILPVVMKKGRVGNLLKVLSSPKKLEEIKKILFEETTTFGIRYYRVRREILERKTVQIKTKYGNVRVKIGYYNGKIVSVSPEYEDCKKLAMEKGVAIKEIYEEAKLHFFQSFYTQ